MVTDAKTVKGDLYKLGPELIQSLGGLNRFRVEFYFFLAHSFSGGIKTRNLIKDRVSGDGLEYFIEDDIDEVLFNQIKYTIMGYAFGNYSANSDIMVRNKFEAKTEKQKEKSIRLQALELKTYVKFNANEIRPTGYVPGKCVKIEEIEYTDEVYWVQPEYIPEKYWITYLISLRRILSHAFSRSSKQMHPIVKEGYPWTGADKQIVFVVEGDTDNMLKEQFKYFLYGYHAAYYDFLLKSGNIKFNEYGNVIERYGEKLGD